MEVDFYIDPETGLPHIHRHGVHEEEVIEVLENPGEDRSGREGSRVAIGQSTGGRFLKVVYASDMENDRLFVITAYEIQGNQLRAYRRRRRRK